MFLNSLSKSINVRTMYLSNIKLWNFRKYGSSLEYQEKINLPDLNLTFNCGLNVLIGSISPSSKGTFKLRTNRIVNISDGIELSRGAVKRNSDISRPGLLCKKRRLNKKEQKK